MRIVFFTDSFKPDLSGLVVAIDILRRELIELGHEVMLVAPAQGKYRDPENNVIRIFSLRCPGRLKKYYLASPVGSGLFKQLSAWQPDVIHLHTPFTVGYLGLKYARKHGVPAVTTFHTHFEEYVHYIPLPSSLMRSFARWSTKDFFNKCQAAVAPGSAALKILQDYGVSIPITVIPSGIDWPAFQNVEPEESRKALGIQPQNVVLVYLGRVAKEKNIPFLFDVTAQLLKEEELKAKIKFLVVGGGPELASIKELAGAKNVGGQTIFTGMIPKEKVPFYLAAGDIFIYSSVTETQGLVVTEAMASGLPVVAVKAMGVEDALKDGEGGFLCRLDVREFAEKLRPLILDENLRSRMGQKAKMSSREFSSRRMAEKMADLYKSLAGRKDGVPHVD
ncbi:MAG: glycosyltransferase family 4 protein [Bacillota bacterium]